MLHNLFDGHYLQEQSSIDSNIDDIVRDNNPYHLSEHDLTSCNDYFVEKSYSSNHGNSEHNFNNHEINACNWDSSPIYNSSPNDLVQRWQQPSQNLVSWNNNETDPYQWNTLANNSFNHSLEMQHESLLHFDHEKAGSDILNNFGLMRSGNSHQLQTLLSPLSHKIDDYSINHGGHHYGHQELIDVIEKTAKDSHFSSLTIKEGWKPSYLITSGFEHDLSSASAQNVMFDRFEALLKIDKNLAGFIVNDIPKSFQTVFITFLGSPHGSNNYSYRLSNYGWELNLN
jgi:hypothetical protein